MGRASRRRAGNRRPPIGTDRLGRPRPPYQGVGSTVGRSPNSARPPIRPRAVAWTPDGRSLVSGDCAGELRIWRLDGSTSTRILPAPVSPKPPALTLVTPDVAPARPFVPRPAPRPSLADRKPSTLAAGDELDAAIASARAAAAAAEQTVAELSRLVRSRTRSTDGADPAKPTLSDVAAALDAANAGLASLRAAMAADPGNAALMRADRGDAARRPTPRTRSATASRPVPGAPDPTGLRQPFGIRIDRVYSVLLPPSAWHPMVPRPGDGTLDRHRNRWLPRRSVPIRRTTPCCPF